MAAHAHGEDVDGEPKKPEAQPVRQPEQQPDRPAEKRAQRRPRADLAELRAVVCRVLAGIVRWVGLIIAVILVVHVVLVIGEANPNNAITEFVKGWADAVALGFQDLFSPADPKLRVLVNYGTAAIFWLVVSSIVSNLIRRLGGEKATT